MTGVCRKFRRLCTLLVLLAWAGSGQAQFFSVCESGSRAELARNMAAHEEHVARLAQKLVTGWYWQGPRAPDFRPVGLDEMMQGLARMAPRRAAALVYAVGEHSRKLCVWLVTPQAVLSAVGRLSPQQTVTDLRVAALTALGVAERGLPVRSAAMSREDFEAQLAALDAALAGLGQSSLAVASLQQLGDLLLPSAVGAALREQTIDTLVVVPVFDLGLMPFAALPSGDGRMLVDLVSVLVAPGFFIFREPLGASPRDFQGALVLGNPQATDAEWHLPPLPGAEAEAREIARMAGGRALLGADASKAAVLARLRKTPSPPLLYFATHGVADELNPLDGGFLVLSDGRWTGREIARQVRRGKGRPLVVLSACQTGLGKTFDVGSIGIARAWHEAGASNVVMSLWRVGDRATQVLMMQFMTEVQRSPPDKALQRAMLVRREADPRPAAWASFAVFGAPMR